MKPFSSHSSSRSRCVNVAESDVLGRRQVPSVRIELDLAAGGPLKLVAHSAQAAVAIRDVTHVLAFLLSVAELHAVLSSSHIGRALPSVIRRNRESSRDV